MTATTIPRSTALVDAGREWGKPLSPDDARVLTAQIKSAVEQLLPLIRTAFQRRADLALGYPSWEAYCDAELVGLRLAVADRQEAVAGLRADGLSQRAIGAALGVSQMQVRRDLAQVRPGVSPEVVAGTDGKQHPASRPTPKPAPAAEPDLGPDVQRALTSAGAAGVTAWQVAFLLDSRSPDEDAVREALFQLCDAGKALVIGQAEGGALWALTELLDDETPEPAAESAPRPASGSGPTPEPAEAPSTAQAGSGFASPAPEPETCLGADMNCGRPLPCPDHPRTPEERIAAVAEVAPEFVKPVEPEDETAAAWRRESRFRLLQVVELLAPVGGNPNYLETWARQLGPYDDELAELVDRAHDALSALDDLISEVGK